MNSAPVEFTSGNLLRSLGAELWEEDSAEWNGLPQLYDSSVSDGKHRYCGIQRGRSCLFLFFRINSCTVHCIECFAACPVFLLSHARHLHHGGAVPSLLDATPPPQ